MGEANDKIGQCLNCQRGQAEVPLLRWQYQDRVFWMCADCLPLIIHKREQLMVKWPSAGQPAAPEGN